MIRPLCRSLGVAALALLVAAPAAFAKDEKKASSDKSVVAVFRLHGQIKESPKEDNIFFGDIGGVSLKDLTERMAKAADDKEVKAVVVLAEGASMSAAQVEEVRQAMAKVRSAGKEVYAHADTLHMGGYVLLSGASRLSVAPTGDLWISGLYGEAPYIRGLLDRLGVKPDFLTCGDYKSAAEMFMRAGPSPEADKMQNWLLDSMYDSFVEQIAKGRGVDTAKVKSWIDDGPYTAEKANTAGLIDAVEHRQEFETMLKGKFGKDVTFNKKYGQKKGPELDLSSPFAMFKIWAEILGEAQKKKSDKPAIGIVYVEGAITVGGAEPSPFGDSGAKSSDLRKALDDAANDDTIKAVVLRVNSPGGSAIASEIILDATRRVKAKKPLVVSMGGVAASGGYYVACAADTIFADSTTITGSIGVVSGKLVTTDMWNKIGITFKAYQRGKNASMLSSSDVFSKTEREKMQGWMDDVYGVFKGHVVAIRGKRLKKPIDELAGGRVYTGKQALELGLVDKIGTMQDAIKHIAGEAKVTDYEVRVVPKPKNFLEILIEESSGGKNEPNRVSLAPRASLVELALPHLRHFDPTRVELVTAALRRLQLMDQEGVLLMMPELRIAP